jgi:hypothetical protein
MNTIIWQLLLQAFLIFLNALFACAEIAMISMNDQKIAQLAAAGDRRAVKLQKVYELAAVARTLVKKNWKSPVRVQALAWRLLERHAEFSEGMADVFIAKANGYDKLALEKIDAMIVSFGRYDYELERWMDFGLWAALTRSIVIKMPFVEQ